MNNLKTKKHIGTLAILSLMATACLGGTAVKWHKVPAPVRATILANGGTKGQSVDLEGQSKEGLDIYEASVKEKNGTQADLNITADGKLIATKHDDAADAALEKLNGAKKALKEVKFSHPRDITNPYLPLATLKQDILEGTEGGMKLRVERTILPNKHKTFKIFGQKIDSLVMEDREFKNGELEEVTLDYFAQDDEGTVYYLGEAVDEYTKGKVTGHDGAWMLGKDTQIPGVILPGIPKMGDQFKGEDVSKDINEADEVISFSDTVTVPAGTYANCLKLKEKLADGTTEYKYFAKGVGVVREVPQGGDVQLISHTTK